MEKKGLADDLRKERMFLEVLCRDYTSVYFFDLRKDTLEILKMEVSFVKHLIIQKK